jgi:hypothetical protein
MKNERLIETLNLRSTMNLPPRNSLVKMKITWPLLPEDFELPDNSMGDEIQPLLAAALRQPLTAFPELMQDALIVSNLALCAGVGLPPFTDENRIVCKWPDWMYVKPVNPQDASRIRRSYTPHAEGSVPQIAIEFLAETYGDEFSCESVERVGKWFFYEQVIKVPTYVVFQESTARLDVYALRSDSYKWLKADENGRYWIPGLDLFLGMWEGTHEGRTGRWLRWWNAEGELLLWSEERLELERQRADREHLRAEKLAEKLRQAGIEFEDEE